MAIEHPPQKSRAVITDDDDTDDITADHAPASTAQGNLRRSSNNSNKQTSPESFADSR